MTNRKLQVFTKRDLVGAIGFLALLFFTMSVFAWVEERVGDQGFDTVAVVATVVSGLVFVVCGSILVSISSRRTAADRQSQEQMHR
jgi:Na+/melibiose symporter-like transporter